MAALEGKNVIITGGARGLGYAFTEGVIEAGGNVAILDILDEPEEECAALIAKVPGRCHYIKGNIAEQESLESSFAAAVEALGGRLDGCVANAGIGTDKPFLEHTWTEVNRVISVNSTGTFFTVQLAVKQFLSQPEPEAGKSRGSVVIIGSYVASSAAPGHLLTAYGGTKGFVRSFCIQLAHEIAPQQIRVNSISPGYIETEMNRQIARQRPPVQHYFTAAPPLQRVGQPSDLKAGLVYLLSDGASYVTGVNLPIDGGMTTGNALTK